MSKFVYNIFKPKQIYKEFIDMYYCNKFSEFRYLIFIDIIEVSIINRNKITSLHNCQPAPLVWMRCPSSLDKQYTKALFYKAFILLNFCPKDGYKCIVYKPVYFIECVLKESPICLSVRTKDTCTHYLAWKKRFTPDCREG